MPGARPLPTVIGPAENALRALLTQIVSVTRIGSYPAWVVLNAADRAGAAEAEGWRGVVADALKADLDEVARTADGLRQRGLIDHAGALTPAGSAELASARSSVAAATSRVTDGISEADEAAARRVLDHIRDKAEGMLESRIR